MLIKHKQLWIILFLMPSVILFSLIYLIPLITILFSSFTRWNGFGSMEMIGFQNYIDIFFKDTAFKQALVNTLLWAAFAIFVHVPFGVMVALILFKKPFGWKFVRSVSLLPNIISTAAMSILYLFIFNPGIGLLNGFVQWIGFSNFEVNWFFDPNTAFLAVTAMWLFFAGVIILITMAELSSIPSSLHEAARIDGASGFQIDLYINLPLIKNIIGVGIILAVTAVFKKFEIIFLTTAGGPGNSTTNIAVLLFNEVVNMNRHGYANALGTILLILGVSVILFVNRVVKFGEKYDF